MKIKKCKNCNSSSLSKLFSLGNLNFTGKFPKSKSTNINKAHLGLVMCKKCSLVQLNRSFNLKYLYGSDYGYKTGINKTMRDHMNNIRRMLSNKSKLNSGD